MIPLGIGLLFHGCTVGLAISCPTEKKETGFPLGNLFIPE